MRFDADAWLAAEAPPTLTVGGRTYTGRHLSAEEQLHHLAQLARLEGEGVSDAAARAIVEAFVDALFPDPISPVLPPRGWRIWRARAPAPLRVLDLFRALPVGAQLAAVQGFAAVLASTMAPEPGPMTTPGAPSGSGTTTPPPQPSTSGFSSRASSRASARGRTTTPHATTPGTA